MECLSGKGSGGGGSNSVESRDNGEGDEDDYGGSSVRAKHGVVGAICFKSVALAFWLRSFPRDPTCDLPCGFCLWVSTEGDEDGGDVDDVYSIVISLFVLVACPITQSPI